MISSSTSIRASGTACGIKPPKIYFTDTGLLCYLLGIERAEQVGRDPLIGNLFENHVVLEALNARYNRGLTPNLYFFRDNQGHEIEFSDGIKAVSYKNVEQLFERVFTYQSIFEEYAT